MKQTHKTHVATVAYLIGYVSGLIVATVIACALYWRVS